jgi:hypothetical protein
MARSLVRDKGDRGGVTIVGCMVSPLAWTVGCAAPPSATGLSTSVVMGIGVLTAAVTEELAFADTVIFKESVAGSVGRPGCPSALLKVMPRSTCRALSQTHEYQL